MADRTNLTGSRSWGVRSVPGDGPGRPAVAATVGLWRPVPDLVVVGVDPDLVTRLLQEVAARLLERPELAVPDQRVAIGGGLLWDRVLLGGCVAPWAVSHAIRTCQLDRMHGADANPLLQVLVPDDTGRFPDHPMASHRLLDRQPVLGDSHGPWRLPHGLAAMSSASAQHGNAPLHALLLPIVDAGHPIARDEAVPALHIGDDLWVVSGQPTLADWCGVGAVIRGRFEQEPVRGLEDAEVVRFEALEQRSPRIVSRWAVREGTTEHASRVLSTLRASTLYQHLVIGETALPHAITITVTTPNVERLDHLMRDQQQLGLVEPRRLFHDPEWSGASST